MIRKQIEAMDRIIESLEIEADNNCVDIENNENYISLCEMVEDAYTDFEKGENYPFDWIEWKTSLEELKNFIQEN